jgi:hypothetical protein
MNIAITDRAHLDAIRRTRALEDAVDQLRRSASALVAAANGEPRDIRKAVLDSMHARLQSMLIELKQLT